MSYQIYQGIVRHRRFLPKIHAFFYRVSMFYFDIADLTSLFSSKRYISINKFNLLSFYKKNYLINSSDSLDTEARKLIQKKFDIYPTGKIYLLTHLSCLGYCFNPISFYFIYDAAHQHIEYIILEVTNTPWRDRHHYILDHSSFKNNDLVMHQFKKELHVSPFMGMDHQYKIYFKLIKNKINVSLKSFHGDQKYFDALLSLSLIPFAAHPAKSIWMTYKVILAIYWQALKLWIKKVPIYRHPQKNKDT